MLLPLKNHHTQTQIFAAQAAISAPTKHRLWKKIIQEKVKAQANLLLKIKRKDFGLIDLSKEVLTGDSTHIEAQAARKYWPALFGENFRRDFMAPDQNRHLNYGYAILRGIIARGICCAGLHPSLGLFHHHRENPYALADDLIKPFRPIVNELVWP